MKNVLILASGEIAQHFVKWVKKSRIDTNHYYITYSKTDLMDELDLLDNINYLDIDPTSLMRIRTLMEDKKFVTIFIVMENRKEAEYTYKNIRMITDKTFIVFVSKWHDIDFDDANLTLLNVNEIMASNLYEKLPNVPLIAKNIGLGQGEIMEVLVPFGSSFAYKHVGSMGDRKWKIVALYRKEKQMFVNNATMLHPNDRLIIIGNPLVLEKVYKKVNRRQGVFPEPFGKNIYLIINLRQDREEILVQVNEAIYLSNQLKKRRLYIRLIYTDNFQLIRELRGLESENINILVTYREPNISGDIGFDISRYNIGLLMMDRACFFDKKFKNELSQYKRPLYLFGEKSLYNIKQALMLMGEERTMETISASIFDFSESLGLELTLCDYNPEGDFQEKRQTVEHYETLSQLYNFKITIERKQVNPILELLKHNDILMVTPFLNEIKKFSLFKLFSTNHDDHIMSIKKHPQLLIPVGGVA